MFTAPRTPEEFKASGPHILADINAITGAARESRMDMEKFASIYNWALYAQKYVAHLESQVESYEKNNAGLVEQLEAVTDKFTVFSALDLTSVEIDFDSQEFQDIYETHEKTVTNYANSRQNKLLDKKFQNIPGVWDKFRRDSEKLAVVYRKACYEEQALKMLKKSHEQGRIDYEVALLEATAIRLEAEERYNNQQRAGILKQRENLQRKKQKTNHLMEVQ
jgi:hypothetical protein